MKPILLILALLLGGCEYQRRMEERRTSTYTVTVYGPSGPLVYQGARMMFVDQSVNCWKLADGADLIIGKETFSYRKETK